MVVVKVGERGKYMDWPIKWKDLKNLRAGALLVALKGSVMFGPKFKDVDLAACTVTIIKNTALPADDADPTEELEKEGANVAAMTRAKTVGNMASDVGAPGAPLFVHVHLPPPTRESFAREMRLWAAHVPSSLYHCCSLDQ